MSNEKDLSALLADETDMDDSTANPFVSLDVLEKQNPGMASRKPTMDRQEARIIAKIRARQGRLLDR